MKRILFFVVTLMIFISCNESKKNDSELKTETDSVNKKQITKGAEFIKKNDTTCTPVLEYPSAGSTSDQVNWLKLNGNNLCEGELYKEVQRVHKIEQNQFSVLNGSQLVKPWSEIKSLIYNLPLYSKYIVFTKSGNNITNVTTVDNFTLAQPCYSIALFKSIDVINDLKLTDNFTFKNARVNGSSTIVFSVVNNNSGTYSHYDFSDNPKNIGKPGSKNTKSPL